MHPILSVLRFVARLAAQSAAHPPEAFSVAALGCISGLAIARVMA